jgi:sterol desaturase/sphingolipid hydroxylase (fatty acid hydroxylase superfamily)
MWPLKLAAIGAWFAALAVAERLWPAAPRPPRSEAARLSRNLGLWVANSLMNPFLTVPIALAAASAQLWTRPDLGLWPGLAVDLLLLDLWTYLWHRANHVWPPLWRFHRVHHLDQFLDASAAVRFHPGEVLISALARAPLIVLADISMLSVVIFDAALLVSALFHHSNIRLPANLERALRWVLVTPSHHWVHHHAGPDTNSNYAALLTLWDRLFGSWSPTRRTPDMAIGVGEPDRPLARLALLPFVRS